MNLKKIFRKLDQNYPLLNPHHDTWELWIRQAKIPAEIFEVAIGTILVQNTSWKNVDRAILNLKKAGISSFLQLSNLELEILREFIQPAGFYFQKSLYLKELSNLMVKSNLDGNIPTRNDLLSCKGIGKETADSILLFCFNVPIPVVGTYTRRFFARMNGNISYLKARYEAIQSEIGQNFEEDPAILSHFHALIVVHSQNRCQKKKTNCNDCFFNKTDCVFSLKGNNHPEMSKIQIAISPPRRQKKTS